MALYDDGHPARERAIDRLYESLCDLQDEVPRPVFTFLGGEVVLGRTPLRDMRHWPWGTRLAEGGIQRLEFIDKVQRDDLDAFLGEAYTRISGEDVSTAEVRQGRPSNIRYGEATVKGVEDKETVEAALATATISYSLAEEIQGIEWLHQELKEGRKLQMVEAESIVRSLALAMHGDQAFLIPLLQLKEFDQYTVTHTLNVAVLTMALAEFLGLGPAEVRSFGIAGLLHDLGKVKIPEEILNKPGKLTPDEREEINRHTVEGARLILKSEEHLDLAAVVAYEHHIRIDGGGYPALRYARTCHQASNLVHVCDVFDALRTRRPYREAWPADRTLALIREGAGPEFDAEIARAFVQMMERWESRVTQLPPDAPDLPVAVPSGPAPDGYGGEPAEPADRGQLAVDSSAPVDPDSVDDSVLEDVVWDGGGAASGPGEGDTEPGVEA
jgi:putative nucleotidyltransferase with HDIG domain